MRYVDFKGTNMKVSRLALGCMRIGDKSVEEVEEYVKKHTHLYLTENEG